ncbi:MAG: hypothetical protein JXA20_04630 [Spirochaetes bacterium]|nr:hypothetical protein [Spirochaetota bacterium]
MMRAKYLLWLLLFAACASLVSCGDTPLLTELESNSLYVVFKGTYESNGPADWKFPGVTSTLVRDDSVQVTSFFSGSDTAPTWFGMDIAEMRLVDTRGNSYKFSDYRQGIAAPFSNSPFFDGSGLVLQNDDVSSGTYVYLMVYMRRMVVDGARKFYQDGDGYKYLQDMTTTFFENTLGGLNISDYMVHSHDDTLTYAGAYYTNRIFPMLLPITGGLTVQQGTPQVLEVRMVLNNFMKLYEYETYDSGAFRVVHFYAPSDWLRDVQTDETTLGGNLHTVVRAYTVGYTGTISGTVAANSMVIAVPAGSSIESYTIPSDLVRGQGSPSLGHSVNCNLPALPSTPGYYMDQYLEYYLRHETYLERWNVLVPGTCTDFDQYQTSWNNYLSVVNDFQVPQLATYTATGPYTIENVPAGTYDVYRAAYTPATHYGTLFTDGDFGTYATRLGTVVVTPGSNVSP